MTYITPDDPAQLAMKMKEVVEEQVTRSFASCSITLDPPADLPAKLQLVVEENGKRQNVPHQLSVDAGWTISKDGAHVELVGSLCDDAKAGRFDAVTFEYGCEELPPLAPD
jgi:hypothetical protein